jgi:hypothetical protein
VPLIFIPFERFRTALTVCCCKDEKEDTATLVVFGGSAITMFWHARYMPERRFSLSSKTFCLPHPGRAVASNRTHRAIRRFLLTASS